MFTLLRQRRLVALIALVSALLLAVAAAPASAGGRHPHHPPAPMTARDRVIAYYQTIYTTAEDGTQTYVDPKPLLGKVTDVNVGAIHLNDDQSLNVNDDPPSAAKFRRMWRDLHRMQRHGVKVSAFVGGAAQGSYANLAEDFDTYYPILTRFLKTYRLDGVDLDIEETFSLDDTVKLVSALRRDFGPRFVITLTPVAADLAGLTDFSGGFSYAELEARAGSKINWYNAQFYCGWGDLADTEMYDKVVANGIRPSRVVAGTVTNPANCGGYVEPDVRVQVIKELNRKYPGFGGVFGWEYFNAIGGPGWYGQMKRATTRR